jgi:hypothetical protein
VSEVVQSPPRPSEFARLLLHALDVAAAASRRRKRDQQPDEVGLRLKRALLERMIAEDPDPEALGDWLLDEILDGSATGPRRAVGADILGEYRLAAGDPSFARWLTQSASQAANQNESGASKGRRRAPL